MRLPALGGISTAVESPSQKTSSSPVNTKVKSKERAIMDIEAKLKTMERDELKFNLVGVGGNSGNKTKPTGAYYQQRQPSFNRQRPQNFHTSKPYDRK